LPTAKECLTHRIEALQGNSCAGRSDQLDDGPSRHCRRGTGHVRMSGCSQPWRSPYTLPCALSTGSGPACLSKMLALARRRGGQGCLPGRGDHAAQGLTCAAPWRRLWWWFTRPSRIQLGGQATEQGLCVGRRVSPSRGDIGTGCRMVPRAVKTRGGWPRGRAVQAWLRLWGQGNCDCARAASITCRPTWSRSSDLEVRRSS